MKKSLQFRKKVKPQLLRLIVISIMILLVCSSAFSQGQKPKDEKSQKEKPKDEKPQCEKKDGKCQGDCQVELYYDKDCKDPQPALTVKCRETDLKNKEKICDCVEYLPGNDEYCKKENEKCVKGKKGCPTLYKKEGNKIVKVAGKCVETNGGCNCEYRPH